MLNPQGAAMYDLMTEGGVDRATAFGMALDSRFTAHINGALSFNLPAIDGGSALQTFDGETRLNIEGSMGAAGPALRHLGGMATQIDALRQAYHVDNIMLGVQVLLGPATAFKALVVGAAGQQALGDTIDKVSSFFSAGVVSLATGTKPEAVSYLLGVDGSNLNHPNAVNAEALRQISQDYALIDKGAKFAVTTAMQLILGVKAAEGLGVRGLPPLRQAYVNDVRALEDLTSGARLAGQDLETTARMAHAERNALKLKYRELSPAEDVLRFEQRNMNKYGDPLGPSIDQLRASGKSWNDIIDSALRPGGKDLGF